MTMDVKIKTDNGFNSPRVQLSSDNTKNINAYNKVWTLLDATSTELSEDNFKKLFNYDLQGKLIDASTGLSDRPMSIGDALISASMDADLSDGRAKNADDFKNAIFAIIKDNNFANSKDIDLTNIDNAKELVKFFEMADGNQDQDIKTDTLNNNYYVTSKDIISWQTALGITPAPITGTTTNHEDAEAILKKLGKFTEEDIKKIKEINIENIKEPSLKPKIENLQRIIKLIQNNDDSWKLKEAVADDDVVAKMINFLNKKGILTDGFLKTGSGPRGQISEYASETYLKEKNKNVSVEGIRYLISELYMQKQGYKAITGKDIDYYDAFCNCLKVKSDKETVSYTPGAFGLEEAVKAKEPTVSTEGISSLDEQVNKLAEDVYKMAEEAEKAKTPPTPPTPVKLTEALITAQIDEYLKKRESNLLKKEPNEYQLKLDVKENDLIITFKEKDLKEYLKSRLNVPDPKTETTKEDYQNALNDFLEMRIRLGKFKQGMNIIPAVLKDVSEAEIELKPKTPVVSETQKTVKEETFNYDNFTVSENAEIGLNNKCNGTYKLKVDQDEFNITVANDKLILTEDLAQKLKTNKKTPLEMVLTNNDSSANVQKVTIKITKPIYKEN